MEPLRDGRYVVRGLLGEGAQGVTFDAVDLREGRPVAIKRFDVRGARSWKDVELAERETRVLATLDHPFLPRYIEHFEENGALYLVMDKVEGETLDAIVRREGPLPEQEVRRFLACADSAFTYLHGRSSPVVHRDVKPRNVVRRPDGSYVFVDFGAVSERMKPRGGSTVVGTYGYMAPEQIQGRALPATDVYAIGATALAALTGVEPDALPHQGLRVDVREALRGRASAAMISSLERMLEPDPDRRPASLGSLLESVRSVSPGTPPLRAAIAASLSRGESAEEDARVRSVRKLLWVLWGLGWPIVMPLMKQLSHPRFGLMLMFGWLAATLIVTWHNGALIRAALRALVNEHRLAGAAEATDPQTSRRRVAVSQVDRQVRIHASDLRQEEVLGETEVGSTPPLRARQH